MESSKVLQQELDEAIQTWRNTWKNCSMEEILQLYSEDVRVMRAGVGLIVGREQLKATLEHGSALGMADIDFHSDEIGPLGGGDVHAEGALVYQRYHEAAVSKDGSEITMVHGFMLWKRVAGKWLIEMYANCAVTPGMSDTPKLLKSIQQAFNQLGQSLTTGNTDKAIEYFTGDCVFTVGAPPIVLKGTDEISGWLKQTFNNGSCFVNIMIDRLIPIAEVYFFSQIVYVNLPTISILNAEGKVLQTGCGNAIVKRVKDGWQMSEAMWNIQSV